MQTRVGGDFCGVLAKARLLWGLLQALHHANIYQAMATSRLRNTFRYDADASDDDDQPREMDEEGKT